MILLCVDGIDPDLIKEWGWDNLFDYNYKLEIPIECFVPSAELGLTPHTTRVWATIFSGQKIDYGLTKRTGLRKIIHDQLVRSKITWKRGKPKYTVQPVNEKLDTILDHYDSFAWNIPTINPEWISTFPGYDSFVKYCRRELMMWSFMVYGTRATYDLEAYYMRYIDYVGHNEPDNLRRAYDAVLPIVVDIKKKTDVILMSDHGCKDGLHTDFAYLGSDHKFKAGSVHEIKKDLERLLRNAGAKRV
jgi:hypothetical protein